MRFAPAAGIGPMLRCFALCLAGVAGAAGAQEPLDLLVDSTADTDDADAGDGTCDVGDGSCTLRAAIQEANAFDGPDTITFDAALNGSPITLVGDQLPVVASELAIVGNGAASTIVQAAICALLPLAPAEGTCTPADYRVLEIAPEGSLALSSLTVRHGRCAGNCSTEADLGGGVLNLGTLTMAHVTVANNAVEESGSYGGGVYNMGTIPLIADSSFVENTAGNSGGGLMNRNGTVGTIVRTIFSGNGALYGAGLYNNNDALDLVAFCTFADNLADQGGALYNDGTLTRIVATTFSGNQATDWGGAILSEGTIGAIDGCTFNNNKSGGDGGAIAYYGGDSGTVANSTFVENSAGDEGGGVWVQAGATAGPIVHCTFSGHEATTGSGIFSATSTVVTNSIVAKGNAGACAGTADGSGNFDDDGSCGTTTSIAPDSDYSTALADNGGATLTLALLPGSVAIDAGGACPAAVGGVDQRGAPRDASCDAGAFEAVDDFLFADGFESSTTAAWSATVP